MQLRTGTPSILPAVKVVNSSTPINLKCQRGVDTAPTSAAPPTTGRGRRKLLLEIKKWRLDHIQRTGCTLMPASMWRTDGASAQQQSKPLPKCVEWEE